MARSELAEKAFARIRETVTDQVEVIEEEDLLRIEPVTSGGFAVQIHDDVRELTIAAGGWHSHSSDLDEICDCAMWLFTPFYRIVQTKRSGQVVKARLERFEPPGQWEVMEKLGILFGWFGRKTTTVLQQNVFEVPQEFLARFPTGAIGSDGFPLS